MRIQINVNGDKKYPIIIDSGIIDLLGNEICAVTASRRVAVVTDSNVAPLYLSRAVKSLKIAGFEVFSFSFTAGEPHKNLYTVQKILQFFCMSRLTRGDIAIALGGGVTGDLTGFASAIYLRGIGFVQVPTTFLSQVDSSIGGKTGCDLPFGKNLCGAFHSPLAVFEDTDTLDTLPDHYLTDGLAESIKAGSILVPELFVVFDNNNKETIKNQLKTVIEQSVKMKVSVTERDFNETGERILLNFGHTFGHAIEKYENYCGMSHGEAISVGMALITRASEKAGLTESGTANKLIGCLEKYELPTKCDAPIEALCNICKSDKKSVSGGINLVILEKIGHAKVLQLPWDKLNGFISEGV